MVDLVRLQVADRAANVLGVLQIDLREPELVPNGARISYSSGFPSTVPTTS